MSEPKPVTIYVSRIISDEWRVDRTSGGGSKWTDTRTTIRELIFAGTLLDSEHTKSFAAFKRAAVIAIENHPKSAQIRSGYALEYQMLEKCSVGDYFVVIEDQATYRDKILREIDGILPPVVHILLTWPE